MSGTEEFTIEQLRSKRRGGQHIGVELCPIIVTHKRTGISATVLCRSQHRSRTIAKEMVEWGLSYNQFLIDFEPQFYEKIDHRTLRLEQEVRLLRFALERYSDHKKMGTVEPMEPFTKEPV